MNSYSYEMQNNSISLQLQNSELTGVKQLIIKARSDDIIQIIGLPTDSYLTPASLIIDSDKLEQAATKLEEHPAEIHFITKKLKIIVNENNGEITIQNIDSEILFQEGARRIVHDVVLDENVNHIQQSFKWADDEAL